jgi:hypothetical protein
VAGCAAPLSLGGAASTHLRALMPEGGVCERLERLVQRRELVRDAQETLGGIHPPIERVYLVAKAIEALEDGVELAVV